MAEAAPVRHVIQGYDVATYVTSPLTPGQSVLSGKYTRLTGRLTHDIEEYVETEEQIAELLTGMFTIEGDLSRGWQDLDVVKRVTGFDSIDRGLRIVVPRFTVTFKVVSPAKSTMNGATVTLKDCMFTSMEWAISAGKGVVDFNMPFRGQGFATPTGV